MTRRREIERNGVEAAIEDLALGEPSTKGHSPAIDRAGPRPRCGRRSHWLDRPGQPPDVSEHRHPRYEIEPDGVERCRLAGIHGYDSVPIVLAP